ncbi:MAG: abortive infection family protein [Solirubrobacteraceae bacterium]
MANHLDLLLALDEYTRDSSSACLSNGMDVHHVAYEAGLVDWADDERTGKWTGELVHLEYLTHGPPDPSERSPEFPGSTWGGRELQRYGDYQVRSTGREEADRMRRLRREAATDAALGMGFPRLIRAWMSEGQRRAIAEPLSRLRETLDNEQYPAAIGAAKELVEAACKVVIERAGESSSKSASLPTLYKQAQATYRVDAPAVPVTKGLVSTVQRLAELRNAVGAGHGRASSPEVEARDGRIAASAGVAVAEFLLSCS